MNKNLLCGVCGDKAIGYNFNGISCPSCKAFFRKYAFEYERFECHYENNCKIDIFTRNDCKRCRLKRCFENGMKKEMILTFNEKMQRKINGLNKKLKKKIKEKRVNLIINSAGNLKNESIMANYNVQEYSNSYMELSSLKKNCKVVNFTNDKELQAELMRDVEQKRLKTIDEMCKRLEEKCKKIITENINNVIKSVPESTTYYVNSNLSLQLLNKNKSDYYSEIVKNYIKHNNNNNNNNGVEGNIWPTYIPRPISDYNNTFNELEGNRLTELLSATQIMNTSIGPINKVATDMSDACLMWRLNCEQEIHKIIKLFKNFNSFEILCPNDQLALVKYGCIEIVCLRIIMKYNYENKCLIYNMENNTSAMVSVSLIKEHRSVLHRPYITYFYNMRPKWCDSDPIIIDLLTAIVFFNPLRPNLIHKDVIKFQQQIYIHLLKRYLRLRYQSISVSNDEFLRLINALNDLKVLYNYQIDSCCKKISESIDPLMREILNIK